MRTTSSHFHLWLMWTTKPLFDNSEDDCKFQCSPVLMPNDQWAKPGITAEVIRWHWRPYCDPKPSCYKAGCIPSTSRRMICIRDLNPCVNLVYIRASDLGATEKCLSPDFLVLGWGDNLDKLSPSGNFPERIWYYTEGVVPLTGRLQFTQSLILYGLIHYTLWQT